MPCWLCIQPLFKEGPEGKQRKKLLVRTEKTDHTAPRTSLTGDLRHICREEPQDSRELSVESSLYKGPAPSSKTSPEGRVGVRACKALWER